MNLANNRKPKQSSQNFGSSSQTFRPGALTAQFSGSKSPNMMMSTNPMMNTVKSSIGLMFGQTLQRQAVDQDFTQQTQIQQNKKIFNYEGNQEKPHATISGGYDLQPQYSLHSPFRNNEAKNEYKKQFSSTTAGTAQESAVRENEIISSIGSQGFELYQNQLIQLREKSEQSKDSKKNTFKKRKGSSESRQGRFTSQGKSDTKRGKSNSGSQTRQKSTSEQRTAGLPYNQTRPVQKESSGLRRPNSAKNLKQVPSMANMQRTLLTSPTQQTLVREPSQNFLPPKPKPLRNSTMAKLPMGLYQSVGSLPTQGHHTNSQGSGSNSKREPSASSDRRQTHNIIGDQYASSSLGHHEPTAFSPVRRNHHFTQPTSNTKNHHSGNKGISRGKGKNQQSQKKLQSPIQNVHNAELLSLHNLSPNLARIQPQQTINEAAREDSWTKNQLQSFDASEIVPKANNLHGNDNFESQDSSLNLKLSGQLLKRNRPLNEMALSQELFKTIKQQIQTGMSEEDKKRKSKVQKIKIDLKPSDQQQHLKKFNIDLMKQELAQRMENKMLQKKAKKPLLSVHDQQTKELELQLKLKKLQAKEQWNKEKEERHEHQEMINQALKQPLKNQSNSLARKRETSKSQSRPFSAKQSVPQEQLLVRVPPVQEEFSPADKQEDSNNEIGLSPGMVNRYKNEQDRNDVNQFIQKQKRERSKRKKKEEQVEALTHTKKENTLKALQEQCMKKFETYKNTFQATHKSGKLKKSKNHKSQKLLQPNENAQPKKQMQHRSKSKKKIDDEKENRRQSISPAKQVIQTKDIRSGTKSRSDKKKRQKAMQHQVSEIQLMALQKNVYEMLSKPPQNLKTELDHNRKPSLNKKSQTLENLHQNVRLSTEGHKNQIMISKAQLKSIMSMKKSAVGSQSQSRDDNELRSSKEESFNQHQIPENQLLNNMMESDSYKHIFVSEQHQELTPIIEKKTKIINKLKVRDSNDSKYAQGIRPIDSLTSFKPSSIKKQISSQLQSQEDMTLFKSQDKMEHILQSQNQQQIVQQEEQKRQLSEKRSSKDKNSELQSPNKAAVLDKKGSSSNSKQTKTFSNRKGSATFKRSQLPLGAQPPIVQDTNKLRNSQTQLNLRPKSAAIEQTNILELLQQKQQQQRVSEHQKELKKLQNFASVYVQKHLKGFLYRKIVKELIKEKRQVDHDLQLVQKKFLAKNESNARQSLDQGLNKHSPIKQIFPDLEGDMNQSSKLEILNDQSKLSRHDHDHGINQSSQSFKDESLSKLSKSEANLKNLIANEHDKLKKQSRPNSSDLSKKIASIHKKKSDSLRSSNNFEQEIPKKSENQTTKVQLIQEEIKEPQTQKNTAQKSLEVLSKAKERKKTFDYEKNILGNDSKRDSFLNSLVNESFQKSHQRKSSFSKDNHSKRNEYQKSQNSRSQIHPGSEEKDVSWSYNRKSLQDFFDHNSQILKEESKRQSIGALQENSSAQAALQNKLKQYEIYFNEQEQKNEQNKNELKRLNDKRMLSPASQKRKLHLEKWVSIQEQKINERKKKADANLKDYISKMDQDFLKTKQILGQSKNSSLRFNTSHDWSQHDMSLGHITSSSIHSTPRIIGSGSLTSNNKQQQQNAIINNLSAFNNNNKSDRGADQMIKPKKLFDYQMSSKQEDQKNKESKSSSESNRQKVYEIKEDKVLETEEIKLDFKGEDQLEQNIFTNNLHDQQEKIIPQENKNSTKDSQIIGSSHQDYDDEEGESLSKMEPPQFQSPTMSAISPNQNMKDYFTDEEEKTAPVPSPPYSGNKIQLPFEENKVLVQINEFSNKNSEKQFKDAFLALKEPELPLNLQELQAVKNKEDDKEIQADIMTDFILTLLLEQMTMNMYPKRVPIKESLESKIHSQNQQNEEHLHQVEEDIIKDSADSTPSLDPVTVDPQSVPLIEVTKNKKVRGIKTSMRIVDGYMGQIFGRVKEQEDEFIESLSTPLNKDPLEILLHLQNAFLDNEIENAVAFQQSVLPVDLYLDLERNKADVQAQDDESDEELNTNKSMMGEWENIHNKVIFDGINEALDNFRPYGLRGPPMPWSSQTRTLTYKNGQQVDLVMRQVRVKVMEWARTFAGALPCSELLQEYGIKGPLDEDKLNMLREERLAQVLSAEIEENEQLWTDYEYEETQSKLDVADMILEFLADEAVSELSKIQQARQQSQKNTTTNTSIGNNQQLRD